MVNLTPNPSYSLTIRFQLPHQAGMLASVTQAIATAGGNIGQIDLIERNRKMLVRDITMMLPAANMLKRLWMRSRRWMRLRC
jgi:malate dehydrogenase (oxaloacetate-decarboxylating)